MSNYNTYQKTVEEWFKYLDNLFNFKRLLEDYGYNPKKVQKALDKEFMYGESSFEFFVTKLNRLLDDNSLTDKVLEYGKKFIEHKKIQTGLGMAQQLPTNYVYDGDLDIMYFDDEEEDMKRLTERFDPPKDWNFEDMLDDYGMEYLQETDSDNEPISMDDFNEFFSDCWEAVRSAIYGGRWGFDRDSFNPTDDYFRFNGYGNVESIPYIEDYLKDMIDEESFYDWCVEQGYFESDEDDE